MNSRIIIVNLIRWFLLLFTQIFLLRNLSFYDLATPFVYVLFLMLLPFGIPNLLLYLIAFGTGLSLDAFYDTIGVHTAACVALAFVRISFISVSVNREGFDEPEPSLGNMGFKWFSIYAILCIFTHHLILFLLEAFKLTDITYTLLRAALSGMFTLSTVILIAFVFFNRRAR